MFLKLEAALSRFRLSVGLTAEQYRLARLVDVELLAAFEGLDRRLRELEARR